MIFDNNHGISCYGRGREGWASFIAKKLSNLDYPYPEQYDEGYGTGVHVDVGSGLFFRDYAEQLNAYVRQDGTFATGV